MDASRPGHYLHGVRPDLLAGDPASRLGRLCGRPAHNAIAPAPGSHGIERIEARFFGDAFTPHRHDTYAIGITLYGVQTFQYRGERRFSHPGKIIVIHPDEWHDGGAGTDDGLRYRMLYLEPGLLRQALPAGSELPFLADPVIADMGMLRTLLYCLEDLDIKLEELAANQLVADIATSLSCHSRCARTVKTKLDAPRMKLARDYLDANIKRPVSSKELEAVIDLNRFEIARQFRRVFGTSPHRYVVMRRLSGARYLIEAGLPLAEVAVETGFADQSHLNRQFKKAYGISPGHWRTLTKHRNSSR